MSKQLKLNELKRVVDVDKFSEYAMRLGNVKKSSHGGGGGRRDEAEIERILGELGKKTPSRDVLLKTRLGFILKDIADNESLSKTVRDKARALRFKWKEFHKKLILAPKVDVKCDKPTTEGRERAKRALESALTIPCGSGDGVAVAFDPNSHAHVDLLCKLEFAVFEHADKLVNPRYFNRVRQCAHLIETNVELRARILRFEISCDELVDSHLKSLGANAVFKKFKTDSSLLSTSSNVASESPMTQDDILLQ